MPVLATRQSAPTVADDVLNLPPDFPEVPQDVLKRFPSLAGWEDEVGSFWMKARQVLNDGIQSHSNAIRKITKPDNGNLRVLIDGLQAAVTTETLARIAGDVALAASISSVVASVGTKSRISVQSIAPSSPAINDLWLDTGDSNRYKFWDGLVWQYKQDLVLAAAVSTEATARATGDGFLEGKYTLTVVAGNVVTGMNITSSTGGGSDISSVIFRATDFLIYNSVTGVAMFTVSGTEIKLGDTLTVDTANSRVFIGTGNYANNDTPFFVDDAGNFSLGGALTWDGTTLSIASGAATTVDWTTQVTSRPTELTDGRITTALNSSGLVISGAHPGINVTTGSAGLYLGADFLGYYNGSAWRTYMDNAGNFYLGGTSGALQWNGTTLSITGSINVSGGNAAKTDFSNVTAAYAGSPSTGGAANTIVGQGSLATVNSANWATQVSARPVELTDGRIAVALTSTGGVLLAVNAAPSGSGLFMGNNFLGYYTGGSWRTYMDNSGNFYLGGTSGALQWNGTTLTVTGVINVTSISGLNYAASSSPGGSASTLTGQGALATQNSASWTTQVSSRPTELTDGRIATALNSSGNLLLAVAAAPSGSGLFLGSDKLGFYTSGAWKTYMDNSGNFYLGGTSGALQWNGTTLTINGGGTFSGALSAATGTFSGTLSAASGSFSGSITSTSGTIGGFNIASTVLQNTNIVLDSSGLIQTGPTSGDHIVLTDREVLFYSGVGLQAYLKYNSGVATYKLQLVGAEGISLYSYSGSGMHIAVGPSDVNISGGPLLVNSIEWATSSGAAKIVESYGAVYVGDATHPFRFNGAALHLGLGSGGSSYSAGFLYFTDGSYLHDVSGVINSSVPIQVGGSLSASSVAASGAITAGGNITASGDLYSYNVNISGYGYGDFVTYSTREWKENIQPLADVSEKLRRLGGWSYQYNGNAPEAKRGKTDIGVIAEDVEKEFPELAVRDRNGTLAINYVKLIPPLLEGWKSHDNEIIALRNEVMLLRDQLSRAFPLQQR